MAAGFLWSANSPYVRGTWVRLRRQPVTLDYLPAEKASIWSPDGTRKNVNPAHMIFECLTNREWGEGSAPQSLDVASFVSACDTLFDEKFGLSMIWTKQEVIENFVSEVLDHIQAYLFSDPRTGLRRLKLLRGDYDPETLEVIDGSSANLVKFRRKGLGETINEIVVSYTDPASEKPATVALHDLANIVSQGGEIISQTRDYYAIRDSELAGMVCARDLRTAAAPLAIGQLAVDRRAWNKTPGDVVRITFPEDDVFGMIVRVNEVEYGTDEDPRVFVSFTEDIFGLEAVAYSPPASSDWVDPSAPPSPMTHQRVFTMPLFLVMNYSTTTGFDADLQFPEVGAGIMAVSSNPSTLSYELVGDVTLANGGVLSSNLGTKTPLGHATTSGPVVAEALTTIEQFDNFIGTAPFLAGFVIFQGETENDDEYALVQEIAEEGFTLIRGALDTVPRAWPEGTPVWFLNLDQTFADDTARSVGETVTYRLRSQTEQGLLSYEDATDLEGTLTERPYLPFRPAKISVAGSNFAPVALNGAGPFDLTWSNRNRLTETAQVLTWTDGNVTPEEGQTTVIRVLRPDNTVAHEVEVANGLTTYALPATALADLTAGVVAFFAKKDGSLSLQGFSVPFTRG